MPSFIDTLRIMRYSESASVSHWIMQLFYSAIVSAVDIKQICALIQCSPLSLESCAFQDAIARCPQLIS